MTLGDLYTKRYFIEMRFVNCGDNTYYYTAPTVEDLEDEETTIGRCSPMEFDATLIDTLEEAQQIAKAIRERWGKVRYTLISQFGLYESDRQQLDCDYVKHDIQ